MIAGAHRSAIKYSDPLNHAIKYSDPLISTLATSLSLRLSTQSWSWSPTATPEAPRKNTKRAWRAWATRLGAFVRVRWPLFWSSQLHASIAFGAIYILFWFATLFLQDAVEPQGLLLNSSASADLPTLIGLPAFLIAPVIAWLVCQAGVPLAANTVAANIRVLILYFIAIVWPLPILLYQWDVYLSSVAGKESDILVWALILGTIATYISGTVFSSKYLGIRNALIALTLSILSWGLFVVVASGLESIGARLQLWRSWCSGYCSAG